MRTGSMHNFLHRPLIIRGTLPEGSTLCFSTDLSSSRIVFVVE
jgi:hypothetical protein